MNYISYQNSKVLGPKCIANVQEIIAASEFEGQEVWDIIMGKFLIAFSVQQYDKFLQWIHCWQIFFCVLRAVKTGFDLLP